MAAHVSRKKTNRPPVLGTPRQAHRQAIEERAKEGLGDRKNQLEFGEQSLVVRMLKHHNIPFTGILNQHVQSRHQQIVATQHEGLQPGFPDMLIFRSPPAWPSLKGIALEMKQRHGKPSDVDPQQRVWLDKLAAEGWVAMVGFGADDALYKLQALGFFPSLEITLPPHRPKDVFLLWADLVNRHGEPVVAPPAALLDAFQSVTEDKE